MKLKDKIKEIRISNNYNQEDFAKLLGVSRNAIAAYENGIRKPGIHIIQDISDNFNIPIENLYETEVNKKIKISKLIKAFVITLLMSLVVIISLLISYIVYIEDKYGYNIYNDELKVLNSSDICIVKINYLEEENKDYKVYNVSCVEYLKSEKKYLIDRIIVNDSRVDINNFYIIIGNVEDLMENYYDYSKDILIENKPFIEEIKDYNETLPYDKQEGKAGNKINYYLNIINSQN